MHMGIACIVHSTGNIKEIDRYLPIYKRVAKQRLRAVLYRALIPQLNTKSGQFVNK